MPGNKTICLFLLLFFLFPSSPISPREPLPSLLFYGLLLLISH